MSLTNASVGSYSAFITYKGKFHLSNELFHKAPDGNVYGSWQKNFNTSKAKKVRAHQTKHLAKARKLGAKLTKIGGGLIVADVFLSGELKPSHGINLAATGIAMTGFGAPIAAVWFIADFGTMGVNYLINGEAKGLGDMLDDKIGTYEMYDGLY